MRYFDLSIERTNMRCCGSLNSSDTPQVFRIFEELLRSCRLRAVWSFRIQASLKHVPWQVTQTQLRMKVEVCVLQGLVFFFTTQSLAEGVREEGAWQPVLFPARAYTSRPGSNAKVNRRKLHFSLALSHECLPHPFLCLRSTLNVHTCERSGA